MKLSELSERIHARILTPVTPPGVEISRVYAGDNVSDLLNHARSGTLVVTNLVNAQLVRLAELMDLSAICLLNNTTVAPNILAGAVKQGTAVLVSPVGMFETCGRLYHCLGDEGESQS